MSLIRNICCLLVLLVILDICIQPSYGLPREIERILRRMKRQSRHRGGYDAQGQDLGYGEGYGYENGGHEGVYEDYCFDCAHCNGCGHAPNRRVLLEYDYVPK